MVCICIVQFKRRTVSDWIGRSGRHGPGEISILLRSLRLSQCSKIVHARYHSTRSHLTPLTLCSPLSLLQNLALNIAEKGFPISVYNRSGDKTDAAVARAQKEGLNNLRGFKDIKEFVNSLERPRYALSLLLINFLT